MPKLREPQPAPSSRAAGAKGRALAPPAYGVALADRPTELGGIRTEENEAVRTLSGGRVDLHALGATIQQVSGADTRLRSVGALSLAQGTRALVSREADRGHELWHLAQQAMGRVRADTVVGGQPVNTDPTLEREADQMGSRIAGFRGASPAAATAPLPRAEGPAPIQGTLSEEMKERIARRRRAFKRVPIEEMAERRRERARQEALRLRTARRAEKLRALRGLDREDEVSVEEESTGTPFAFSPPWSQPVFGQTSTFGSGGFGSGGFGSGGFGSGGFGSTTPFGTSTFGSGGFGSGGFGSGGFESSTFGSGGFGSTTPFGTSTFGSGGFGSGGFGSGGFKSSTFGSGGFGSSPFSDQPYREPTPLWGSTPSLSLGEPLPLETSPFTPSVSDWGIEELISGFESLTIHFTDKDGEHHAVYPDPEAGDAIVASNPTPLKAIIAAGKWEKIAISSTDLTDLQNAQTNIADELKSFGKNRSQAAGRSLRDELNEAARILKGISNIPIPKTDLSGSKNYGQNASPIEGKRVRAEPLSLKGDDYGFGPQTESRLMKAIRKAAPGNEGSSYIRMHLLNDNVRGPGELWNLTPGPSASNGAMERDVEDPLKRAIIGSGVVMTFEATVDYNSNPMAEPDDSLIKANPNKYRFKTIDFEATQWFADSKKGKYVPGTNKDPDVKDIDGASVRWNWGSLTPLVPKPEILSCTDPTELTDIGISSTTANKIVAFNKKGPGFALKGLANKEKQLADAIHDWETSPKTSGGLGKAKAQRINLDGKANEVLWK